ncbi:TPA: hypothetical protein UL921_001249 [Stenotrophomonas maltophilia]|nr:hypothetical protein [Stenotrophomonas maltophilia]
MSAYRHWGFGLCLLRSRHLNGFGWQVYRIYREVELNLRIKPRNRMVREVPEQLEVPAMPHLTWSIDLMRGQPVDGRSLRILSAPHHFNREGVAKQVATRRLWIYNNERPSMALGGITLMQMPALAHQLHFLQQLGMGD